MKALMIEGVERCAFHDIPEPVPGPGEVLVAVRHAPVGYVTALRESSVVLAALAGWKLLGEGDHRRRLTAALVVFAGLLTLVLGR